MSARALFRPRSGPPVLIVKDEIPQSVGSLFSQAFTVGLSGLHLRMPLGTSIGRCYHSRLAVNLK